MPWTSRFHGVTLQVFECGNYADEDGGLGVYACFGAENTLMSLEGAIFG